MLFKTYLLAKISKIKSISHFNQNMFIITYPECHLFSEIAKLFRYLEEHRDVESRTFGLFLQWLVNDMKINIYGMKLPTGKNQTKFSRFERAKKKIWKKFLDL